MAAKRAAWVAVAMNPAATLPLSGGASYVPAVFTRAMSAALKMSGGGIREAAPVTDAGLRSTPPSTSMGRHLRPHMTEHSAVRVDAYDDVDIDPTGLGVPMTAVIEASRIVRWRHRRGVEAHCLARLVRSPTGRHVAVLTELSPNPEGSGVAGDAAAAAAAFMVLLRREPTPIPPESITWVLQHGAYSYPDAVQEPETFTAIALTWAADRFTEDRSGEALLDADQQRDLFGDTLPPVERDVAGAAAEQP